MNTPINMRRAVIVKKTFPLCFSCTTLMGFSSVTTSSV